MKKEGDSLEILGEKLTVGEFLGRGKSGYSYLLSNKKWVLKQIHHEPCAYYQFGDKLAAELEAYKILSTIGINIPRLITYDKQAEFLIKEYIEGTLASELISQDKISDIIVERLFACAKKCQQAQINIDYFPTNFVIRENQLFYVDYELNQYLQKWDLVNWGIYYWANSSGMRRFLECNDYLAINVDAGSGIPIKKTCQEKVGNWIKRFSFDQM